MAKRLTLTEHGAIIRTALEEGRSYRDIGREPGFDKNSISLFAKVHFPELRRRPQQTDAHPLRILIIDIETAPNLAYVWGTFKQYVSPEQMVVPTEMLCFAAKWLDDPVVRYYSKHLHGKSGMVEGAHALLDRADAVMHYNGTRFDVPHLNREFLEAGFTPPSPFKQIDLLKVVRRRFRFTSNKLAAVAKQLGLGTKVEHEGFNLWVKCMADDADAWARMRKYNIQDVLLVEELYHRLLPWVDSHPSIAAFTSEDCCPNCGGELGRSGWAHTRTGKYEQFQCAKCGKYSRATKRTDHTNRTEVT